MAKTSLKQALRLNLDEMLKMKRTELEDVYRTIHPTVSRRVSTFKKHGAEKVISKTVQKLKGSPRSYKNKRELTRAIADMQLFMFGERSSYTKYQGELSRVRELLFKRYGLELKSKAQLEKYGNFMNDIKKRFPDLMKKGSEEAVKLYKALDRLGINQSLKTFYQNYDYWLEQIDILENVPQKEIIKARKGSYSSLSKYMDSLNLESIKDYRKRKAKEQENEL